MAKPTLWQEVISARRLLHDAYGDGPPHVPEARSMETWEPGEIALWHAALSSALHSVAVSLSAGESEIVDPRDCLIHVMSVASAWVDAMDQRSEIG